jgi:hypothetical protein
MEFSVYMREVSKKYGGAEALGELIELRFHGNEAQLFVGSGDEPRGTYTWCFKSNRFLGALPMEDPECTPEAHMRVQNLAEQIVRRTFAAAFKTAARVAGQNRTWNPDRRFKYSGYRRPYYSGESMCDAEHLDGDNHEFKRAIETNDKEKLRELCARDKAERAAIDRANAESNHQPALQEAAE